MIRVLCKIYRFSGKMQGTMKKTVLFSVLHSLFDMMSFGALALVFSGLINGFTTPMIGMVFGITLTSNPVSAALAKLQGYDLQGKYKSTRIICEYITKEADLFLNLPHVFIFLTEFTDKNPMGGFADMMIQLATTSSQVDYSIQQPIVEGMRNRLQTISCSNSRYLNCMELDAFIKNPF